MTIGFKQFIAEKTYYLDVDNRFDSTQTANSSEEALKKLFPKAKKISFVGSDKDGGEYYSVYEVKDAAGKSHTVNVFEK